jgi:proteasome component ECM29
MPRACACPSKLCVHACVPCAQALGQLATRLPSIVIADTNAAARLFAALASEPAGARAAVAEASGALCAAYATASSPFLKDELLALVSAAAASPSDGVRAAAVRWARGLFPFASAPARYVCILAAGDAKLEVREEGVRGLAAVAPAPPPLVASAAAPPPPPDPAARHPPLEAMLATLAGAHPRLARAAGALAAGGAAAAAAADAAPLPGSGSAAAAAAAAASSQALLLPARGYAAAVSFLRDCRAAERRAAALAAAAGASPAASAAEAPLAPPLYRAFMEAALARDAPAELWIAALAALLDAAADAPTAAAAAYAPRASWLRTMLSHTGASRTFLASYFAQLHARAASCPRADVLLLRVHVCTQTLVFESCLPSCCPSLSQACPPMPRRSCWPRWPPSPRAAPACRAAHPAATCVMRRRMAPRLLSVIFWRKPLPARRRCPPPSHPTQPLRC